MTRWLVYDPDNNEWMDFLDESQARDFFNDARECLEDASGDGWPEGADHLCLLVARPVLSYKLERYATSDDDTEDGERCRRNLWNYLARGIVVEHPPEPDAALLDARAERDAALAALRDVLLAPTHERDRAVERAVAVFRGRCCTVHAGGGHPSLPCEDDKPVEGEEE